MYRLALVGLIVGVVATSAFAFDDPLNAGADLIVADGANASTSAVRTPEAVLADIEAILNRVYEAQGGAFTVTVTEDTQEDITLKSVYEQANAALKALWKEFDSVVNNDKLARAQERDQNFRQAMDQAFSTYRANFGTRQADPVAQYTLIYNQVATRAFTLRWDKRWMDKYVEMSDFVQRPPSSSANPTTWDANDVVYAMGLLPSELLKDVNMSIRASFFYGYMRQCHYISYRPSYWDTYAALPYQSLSWDAYVDDDYYYSNIYDSSYLVNDLTTTFAPMSPRPGNPQAAQQAMASALQEMQSAMQAAQSFSFEGMDRDEKGRMRLEDVNENTWNKAANQYRTICQKMKLAMQSFHRAYDQYQREFPGDATVALQKSMQLTFNAYRKDFVYGPVDQLSSKHQALRDRIASFKLKRVGRLIGDMGAVDKDLYRPGSWRAPRKDLYSAQRVVKLLPADMTAVIDSRRQSAFTAGAKAAEADYRNAQQPVNTNPGGTYNPGGTWNDQPTGTNGGTWNDQPTGTNGGTWNDQPTGTNGNTWNDQPSGTNGNTWNDTGTTYPNTSGGSWNDN